MNADFKFSIRVLWPVIALVLTLAWASGYDQGDPQGPDIPNFDKIAHFFVFGLMGTLWFRCLPKKTRWSGRWLIALILTMTYGVVDEWIQSSNPQRSSDLFDWLADGLGALTGIFVYRNWNWYRRVLETRVSDLIQGRLREVE